MGWPWPAGNRVKCPGPLALTVATDSTTAVTSLAGTEKSPATSKVSVPPAGRVLPAVPLEHWAAGPDRWDGLLTRVSQIRVGVRGT